MITQLIKGGRSQKNKPYKGMLLCWSQAASVHILENSRKKESRRLLSSSSTQMLDAIDTKIRSMLEAPSGQEWEGKISIPDEEDQVCMSFLFIT